MQRENSQLEREIQRLKLQLQILPELHQEHILQLQRKLAEEEMRHLHPRGNWPACAEADPQPLREDGQRRRQGVGEKYLPLSPEVLFLRKAVQKAGWQLY